MNAVVTSDFPQKAKSPLLRDEFAAWLRMKNYKPTTIRDYVADVVDLPNCYGKKNPGAEREWGWQYVFAARDLSVDPKDGRLKRYHIFEKTVQAAVKKALGVVGIFKRASTHTFRHSFATHLLEDGVAIYDVQKLLGHKRVETTMIYNHVASPAERRIKSPMDSL